MANLRVGQTLGVQIGARIGQHRLVDVEAEAALEAVGKQFERPPGAGAEIEEKAERPVAQRFLHRLLDVALGDVQRANVVPVGRMFFEKDLRRSFAVALQGIGALAIKPYRSFRRIDVGDQAQRQAAAGVAVGEVEIDPAPFPEALDQPGLVKQLQMAADAGLALTQDESQVLDVQFASREQQQDAQARRLGSRFQGRNQVRCSNLGSARHCQQDIKICLYVKQE